MYENNHIYQISRKSYSAESPYYYLLTDIDKGGVVPWVIRTPSCPSNLSEVKTAIRLKNKPIIITNIIISAISQHVTNKNHLYSSLNYK